MKVYITYDRYERDEWYNIYYVSTNRDESINHCLEVDLVDFITYGPDDCHSFQLQEVEMTKEEYDTFKKWIDEEQDLENYGPDSSELFNKMYEIYDDYENIIISSDGCSDFYDLVHYYGNIKGVDTLDDMIFDEVNNELMSDEELFYKVLRDYIKHTY
jgi:hypothetical protein